MHFIYYFLDLFRLAKNYRIVLKSGLFDEGWYLEQYPDVARSGINPIRHYLTSGARDGRKPSLGFDTQWYIYANADVAKSSMNPLVHYIRYGRAERRTATRPLDVVTPKEVDRAFLTLSAGENLKGDCSSSAATADQIQEGRLLSNRAFARLDSKLPKNRSWWVFPVCAYDGNLSGNERAIFELVKDDLRIKKIILTRHSCINLQGQNVCVAGLATREGQSYLLRSAVVFVKHSLSVNLGYPLDTSSRYIINLWHGVPLKRIGTAVKGYDPKPSASITTKSKLSVVIASSKIDKLAVLSSFQPISYDDVWLTGLPRMDFLNMEIESLPSDFRFEEDALRSLIGEGKKLLFFCPTFRDNIEDYYEFSAEQLTFLSEWLRENHYVLGVREHTVATKSVYLEQLKHLGAIDLGISKFANIEVVFRVADVVISDYSSCMVDFMITGRPVISFAYDYEAYLRNERGFFYDLAAILPGPVCLNFTELAEALSSIAKTGHTMPVDEYGRRRRMLIDYQDGGSAERVVSRVIASVSLPPHMARRYFE